MIGDREMERVAQAVMSAVTKVGSPDYSWVVLACPSGSRIKAERPLADMERAGFEIAHSHIVGGDRELILMRRPRDQPPTDPPTIYHYAQNLTHDEFQLKLDELAADGWELDQFSTNGEYRVSSVWRKRS